ncbi:Myb/SANT-like DNA-binding domain [Popillia japonica]|uniref:Regulatory protein zeste n=1 Tax=Popillia japonica TaxID=7064 RepID=A0AAW1IFT6_POPJA
MAKVESPYTAEEKERLVQVLKAYSIIECKQSDATTIKKKAAWENVEKDFNASGTGEKRTVLQLKRCWDKIKRQRKEINASDRRNRMATGGGPSTLVIHEKIVADVDAIALQAIEEIEWQLEEALAPLLYMKKLSPMSMPLLHILLQRSITRWIAMQFIYIM